ncbi:hypothetical protein NT6N_16550 [Oceaniferula spumae]|uniref:Calcineurin-like phosphoesterase domain-containing protein n=1 Tax=Oceaniferula spumae TaxID=2979115 RepID=A0AAT9FKX2_9BACT
MGIITDLHFGNLAPDAKERLEVFAKAVAKEKPDDVIQLGDFCHPEEQAKKADAVMELYAFPQVSCTGEPRYGQG